MSEIQILNSNNCDSSENKKSLLRLGRKWISLFVRLLIACRIDWFVFKVT